MAAKYQIKLLCGHLKHAYDVSSNRKAGYYCMTCHKESDRDMSVEAKRISIGVTGS